MTFPQRALRLRQRVLSRGVMLALFTVMGVVDVARGQDDHPDKDAAAAIQPDDPRSGLQADDAYTDVYLNDSFEASDAIAKARRLATQGRWHDAVERLQRVSDAGGDKLAKLSSGSYIGLRAYINNIIAGFPEAGIKAYRDSFEREMVDLLDAQASAPNLGSLLALFERYYCTSAAAKLADAIGQLAIEAGDLATARRVYLRALRDHPDAATYEQRYLSMLALLASMDGRDDVGTDADPDTTIRWMGQDRRLGDVLTEAEAMFAVLRKPPEPTEWPTFAGRTQRDRLGTWKTDDLGLLWSFDGFTGSRRVSSDVGLTDMAMGMPRPVDDLAMHIVASGPFFFVQQQQEVVALHRRTGKPAWRFQAYASESHDPLDVEDSSAAWESVTVEAGRVYASLPSGSLNLYSYDTDAPPAEVVCLAGGTGEVVWRVSARDFPQAVDGLGFDAGPVVQQGRVFVVGRRRRSFGFEDCYLFCLDASTGTPLFRTHLGSGSTGRFDTRRATMSLAAIAGDTVYVCTNLGSVAAVSVYTGAVRWLRLYERDPAKAGRESGWGVAEEPGWTQSPLIVSKNRIIVLPRDGKRLQLLAADNGRVIREISTDKLGGLRTVLAVDGSLLFGVGDDLICYNLSTSALLWSQSLADERKPHGRGVVTDEAILLPTTTGMDIYQRSDGKRIHAPWVGGASGGNLLALPHQLLVAGSGQVWTYVRKSAMWQALRERMAAAADDPLPALELAEVAMRGGETVDALAALAEAVDRADALSEPTGDDLRRRFFEDAIDFAEMLVARGAVDSGALPRLLRYAERYPSDTEDHLIYRIRFAALHEDRGERAAALALYQQILRDRSLRNHPITAGLDAPRPAGNLAEAAIARLIEEAGRETYAPYEATAKQWLEGGRTAGDEAMLLRVVETFPNSEAAPVAMVAHGELLMRTGHPTQAARRLVLAYRRYGDRLDQPTLLRQIADAYEAADQAKRAYQWLTKAARDYPAARFDAEGNTLSFLQYRQRLASVADRLGSSRPVLAPPLEHQFARTFDADIELLTPRYADDPASRWDRFYVSTPAGVRCFAARTNEELWAAPAPVRAAVELLLVDKTQAIFATAHEVFALDAATGAVRWSHADYPAKLGADAADWEDGLRFRSHALGGRQLASLRDDGRLSCVSLDTGLQQWTKVCQPMPAGSLWLVDQVLVYAIQERDELRLERLDAATGESMGALTLDQTGHVQHVLLTLDEQLVVVTTQSIACYDMDRSTLRWLFPLREAVRSGSLVHDLDALIFSDNGRGLIRLRLANGQIEWRADRLIRRGSRGLRTSLVGDHLIVTSSDSAMALDAVNALILWEGTAPDPVRFVSRFVTPSFLVAVNVPEDARDEADALPTRPPGAAAYFYDLRNASGVIPRDGGVCPLDDLEDIRALLALDGALVIQTGSRILGWTQ